MGDIEGDILLNESQIMRDAVGEIYEAPRHRRHPLCEIGEPSRRVLTSSRVRNGMYREFKKARLRGSVYSAPSHFSWD